MFRANRILRSRGIGTNLDFIGEIPLNDGSLSSNIYSVELSQAFSFYSSDFLWSLPYARLSRDEDQMWWMPEEVKQILVEGSGQRDAFLRGTSFLKDTLREVAAAIHPDSVAAKVATNPQFARYIELRRELNQVEAEIFTNA